MLINREILPRVLNVGLRCSTLASKFILVFFLAKYLAPNELGLYGLIIATIAYGIYPLGFEFYTYSAREIIAVDENEKGRLLKSQLFLHLILYVVILPLFLVLFFLRFIPWSILLLFYILLILEHLNQEFFRLLVAMSKQLSASVSLFFRQGIWSVAASCCMYLDASYRSLEFVLLSWFVGSFLALLMSLFVFLNMPIGGWGKPVDWLWVKKGLKIAIPFLIATIGTNGILTIDKYLFDFLNGKELLGAYVFYLALSASFISFLDAGVFSFMYPSMIRAANEERYLLMRKYMRRMLVQVIIFSFLFLIVAHFAIEYVLLLIDKNIYSENSFLFYMLFAAMFFQALSYVPHYGLYAKNKDKAIILSGVCSLFIFLVAVVFLSFWDVIYAIPASLIVTYVFVLAWKWRAYKQSMMKELF